MKFLVTGGAGFIGSTFIRHIVSMGHQVVNVDILTNAGNPENLQDVSCSHLYSFEKVDICDQVKIRTLLQQYKPDKVVNFAAESHVDTSISMPKSFIETNIFGTFNLLEASKEYWKSSDCSKDFCFHHISTDEVYGTLQQLMPEPFSENSRYNPRNPYSASKAASDHLINAWHHTHGLPTLLTNCSNNYGPFQSPDKLIPLVITNALLERTIPIYGDGSNIRDWLFVDDHIDALLLVLTSGTVGARYNIGGDSEITNIQLVQRICKILDSLCPRSSKRSYGDLISFVSDRPGHDQHYSVDFSKISTNLGWQPKTKFETGLLKTIEWYLENESWWRNLV